jgi:hypothetical protein
MTTPSVNAHNTTTSGASSGGFASGGTLALTATQPNCLIVVWYMFENAPTAPTGTAPTAAGLTFTKLIRFSQTSQAGPYDTGNNVIEVWTAPSVGAFSGNITLNFTGTGDINGAYAQAIYLDGVNIPVVSANVSIPATGFANSGTSLPTVAGISTNGAALVLTGACNAGGTGGGADGAGPLLTAGSGYSIVDAGSTGAGSFALNCGIQSQQFASAQSGISSAFATTMESWVAVSVAFEGPGGGPTLKASQFPIWFPKPPDDSVSNPIPRRNLVLASAAATSKPFSGFRPFTTPAEDTPWNARPSGIPAALLPSYLYAATSGSLLFHQSVAEDTYWQPQLRRNTVLFTPCVVAFFANARIMASARGSVTGTASMAARTTAVVKEQASGTFKASMSALATTQAKAAGAPRGVVGLAGRVLAAAKASPAISVASALQALSGVLKGMVTARPVLTAQSQLQALAGMGAAMIKARGAVAGRRACRPQGRPPVRPLRRRLAKPLSRLEAHQRPRLGRLWAPLRPLWAPSGPKPRCTCHRRRSAPS